MAFNNSFRSWVNSLMGASEPSQEEEAAGTSSEAFPAAGMPAPESDPGHPTGSSPSSMTSVISSSSKASIDSSKEPSSKRSFLRRSFKKGKMSNVVRNSGVEPRMGIVPPLSSLPPGQETDEKLARVLEKFNSIDLTEDLPPVPDGKVDK
uniref:Uncharacterized protein n=1 Tax=Graphocephala atropunctata TaxID=36148 RepID=A0A1B6KK13_9HEMI